MTIDSKQLKLTLSSIFTTRFNKPLIIRIFDCHYTIVGITDSYGVIYFGDIGDRKEIFDDVKVHKDTITFEKFDKEIVSININDIIEYTLE